MQVANLTQPGPGMQEPLVTSTAISGNTKQLNNSADPAADTLSITSSKIMLTRQLVTQQVEIALEIKSPVINTFQANDDAVDQTDQLVNKVVQKIHDEKSSGEENLSDEERHLAAVKSVRVKVAQGFESATLALNHLGVMDNAMANDVEQTRSRVDAAIDQVASRSMRAMADETAAVNISAKRELVTSLQVTTRDGDVVTVNFSRNQAMTAGSAEGPEGTLVYAGSASSSLVELSVQGELSEKESESIRKVVEDINKLAEKLFTGKTGAAMEKLSELKINSEYLAGMSLSMSSSLSYQAVSAYAQVSGLPDERAPVTQGLMQGGAVLPTVSASAGNSQSGSAAETPGQVAVSRVATEPVGSIAVQVARETADVVNETVASDMFDNPFNEVRNLFAQIADMFTFEQSNVKDDHHDFISELFKNIVDKLEEKHGADHDDETDGDVVENIA